MNGNTVRSLDDNDVSRQKVITAMSRKLKENGHQNGEKPDLANSLVLMGFTDRQVNCQALKATNNVLKDAVAWLIERNRVSIAKLESEKRQEQELKRQTLPVVNSTNRVFGARSSGLDYFATSKSPSMALLPKWLLKLLVNPGFRRFASSKRYTIDSNCDAATGIWELAQQWEKLSDQSRSHYETMWPDALQSQVVRMRKRFNDTQHSTRRVMRKLRRRVNIDEDKKAPQNWKETAPRSQNWNSNQHFDQYLICEMPEDPLHEGIRKINFPTFWKQCEEMFLSLEPKRIISSAPGSRDEQRRELLEDEKVLNFFQAIDPKLKVKTSTTTTTTTTTKSAIEQGEARSALNDLLKHLNVMLNQQIEKNALLRKRLKSNCMKWAIDRNKVDEKMISEVKSRWLQCKSWKVTSDCLCRGVKPKTLNFNSYRPVKLPPSWQIAVHGRPEAHNVNQAVKQPQLQQKQKQFVPIGDENDTICGICFDGESTEKNPIVFCETCDLPLHQSCYGIKNIPEGDYFCDRCLYIERQMVGSAIRVNPKCMFCPVKAGAMKCTNNTNEWTHVMCALWHHDHVTIGDKATMSNISCKNDFLNTQTCSICNQKSGLTFECSKPSCKNRFHPICAWYGGSEIRITRVTSSGSISKETEGKVRDGLRYIAYCSECSDCDLGLQQQIRMKYCNEKLHEGLLLFLKKTKKK